MFSASAYLVDDDPVPRWNPRLRRWEEPGKAAQPMNRRRHRGGWTRQDRRPLSPTERQALEAQLQWESQAAFAARVGVSRVTLWRALAGCSLVGGVRETLLSPLS
jgi:hypothetical protein